MDLILASGSPRRKEILENAGYRFKIITADADETLPDGITPEDAVKLLAELKGNAVAENNSGVVVSADTVVAFDGNILGKPEDEKDAERMLKMLSGNTHSVYTGVCVQQGSRKISFFEKTDVKFYPLSDEEIRSYIDTKEPMDKAGAYGIQGKGAVLVEKINGDYLNVVGLPLARLSRVLKQFGF